MIMFITTGKSIFLQVYSTCPSLTVSEDVHLAQNVNYMSPMDKDPVRPSFKELCSVVEQNSV